ncbi:MAG TPA: hypothetical protein VN739_03020 [Nitrososphaerales archaeon]|nr:hypothetical protein [Nitrososphaerales archaeon]
MPELKPAINVFVEDPYTRAALQSYSLQEPLTLRFTGSKRNLENQLTTIRDSIKKRIHPLVLDLYNIAFAVYVWDLNTTRNGIYPRDCRVLMSVSNRDRWFAVKNHLEATLRFLTGDNFVFHFVEGKTSEKQFVFEKKDDRTVSLFSGGLDSLAGAKWLKDQGQKPLLVSHRPHGLVSSAQGELVEGLKEIYGELDWYQIGAAVVRSTGLEEKQFTQFSRSFLYLTLGSLFALQLGIDEVDIFENGILALNIPLSQSRIYSNTRTAHPLFLIKYEKLLTDAFGSQVKIRNPFVELTKGEVVKFLDNKKLRDLLPLSVSCSSLGGMRWGGVELKIIRNCGYCFPCVIRRIAVNHAGLWDYDGKYKNDIFAKWSGLTEDAKRLLLEMNDFGRRIKSFASVDDALSEFPQFYVHESIDPAPLFETTKRQVEQMENCFSARGSPSLKNALNVA